MLFSSSFDKDGNSSSLVTDGTWGLVPSSCSYFGRINLRDFSVDYGTIWDPASIGYPKLMDYDSMSQQAFIIVVVTVNEPTFDLGADIPYCPITDGAVNIGANAPSGMTKYEWSPVISLSQSDIQNPTAEVEEETTFILKVTDANGCTSTDDITLTFDDVSAPYIVPETTICVGQEIKLGINSKCFPTRCDFRKSNFFSR